MAVVIPDIGLFISLVGAVGSSFLALIFPPLIDSILHSKASCWKHIKNTGIVLFGVIGFLSGTYVSIINVIDFFVNGTHGASEVTQC